MSALLPGYGASVTTTAVFVQFLGSLKGAQVCPLMDFIPLQSLQRDGGFLPGKPQLSAPWLQHQHSMLGGQFMQAGHSP